MLGDYRLFRQGGGRAAFAHVYVQIFIWDRVAARLIVDLYPDDTSTATPSQEPKLFDAALEGCRIGLEILQSKGIETNNYQVVIKKLLINVVDTRPDVVRASASLATITAFGMSEQFQLIFSDDEWTVRFVHSYTS